MERSKSFKMSSTSALFVAASINLFVGLEYTAGVYLVQQLVDLASSHVGPAVFPVAYSMGALCALCSISGILGIYKMSPMMVLLLVICNFVQSILTICGTILVMDGVVIDFNVFCTNQCPSCDNNACKNDMQIFCFTSGLVMFFATLIFLQSSWRGYRSLSEKVYHFQRNGGLLQDDHFVLHEEQLSLD